MAAKREADHFSRRARSEGYAARSVYKLQEIDRRFRVIPQSGRVLDLGCAPGSWSRFVRKRAGAALTLVGVDLTEVQGYPGVFIQGSVHELDSAALREALGGAADLVMTDMAPHTTGARDADHYNQVELARRALAIAAAVLRPGGHFVAKVFDGAEANDFVAEVKARFGKVKRVRPKATRSVSREFFVVAQGHRGTDQRPVGP